MVPHLTRWKKIMTAQRYRVIFEGEILDGLQVEEVKRGLATLFKASEAKIERFFSGKRLAVKKDVDYETAMKYLKAFERAGAACRVEALGTYAGLEQPLMMEKEKEEVRQQDLMICPKCQFEQEESEECLRCGIIVSKFYQRPHALEAVAKPGGPEADLIAFIGDNAHKYISKFKKFNQGGTDSFAFTWHWPAFFFGPVWLWYRKLNRWAWLALVLDLIPVVDGFAKITFALTGNYIYYKHCKSKIKELRRSKPSSDLSASLALNGGVNRLAVSFSTVLIILALAGAALYAYNNLTGEKTIGKISFYTDYDQGLDQAFESGKPVMLVFSASWCGSCKQMIKNVFSHDDVAYASKQLVNIYVDVDKANRQLINEYAVKYVPSVFFLDYSGETIIKVADRRSPDDFIENMDYMVRVHSYNQQN
jgi:thiol-disulfide isomerase/thioredoxin